MCIHFTQLVANPQVKASEEEVKALRKELAHVRQERDILKKALAIFSGPQGRGTSL